MGRHGAIGGFVRIVGIPQSVSFFIGFELPDDAVGILGGVFGNSSFNTGSVKEEHRGFLPVNPLADQFGQVNKTVEHRL